MTVKVLIEQLQTCPEDYEVKTWMGSGDIEEVYGVSVVCEDTKTIAISGKVDWPSEDMFKYRNSRN